MLITGYILFSLGVILGLAGELVILTAALRRGVVLFIACLVLPFVAYAYALTHLRKLWLPLLISTVGCCFAFLGLHLCGSQKLMEVFFG